jgi:transposase
MSLKPSVVEPVPRATARVARAAFPKGNLYISMRDKLGTLFEDVDFTELYPRRGQSAFAPWRLALITVMQFLENLSDRQAAEAVRSRIDWKYALSLELTDSGFDHSVLSHFRDRLIESGRQELLLDRVLDLLREKKLLKERGKQRTDSTHVLAAIRVMNRLELVMETLRAALNDLSEVVPIWLSGVALPEWFVRYAARIEDTRLPRTEKARQELAEAVGADGFYLLERIRQEQPDLLKRESVEILQQVWRRHYTRDDAGEVHWRTNSELGPAAEAIESPYDREARHSRKREIVWTGYKVHFSETCDEKVPRLVTNVLTTRATEQDVSATADIHEALKKKGLLPSRHLVDAGYVDAELLVESEKQYMVELFGPTRVDPSWQARTGGYAAQQFTIDWEKKRAICPQGKASTYWYQQQTREQYEREVVKIRFSRRDCLQCVSRGKCVKSRSGAPRMMIVPAQPLYESLKRMRQKLKDEEGRREYQNRAGVEAMIAQAVRRSGARRSRYKGLEKTQLQEVATAAGINVLRTINFLENKPLAKTRKSRFARLSH